MEELSLYDIISILKRRFKIIVILPIILVIVFGIISLYFLEPEYEASTTIMVGEARLAHTYLSLIEDGSIYEDVINNLNGSLDVSLVKDPEILKIGVRHHNPELAANIANEVTSIFMDKSKDFLDKRIQIIDGVEIIEEPLEPKLINEAEVPTQAINPNPKLNMIIAGVLGLILGVFLVFILEFLDRTIKSSKDIEKYLKLPVIGSIPKKENNKTQLISEKNIDFLTIEAYNSLITNIEYLNINKKLKSIAIISPTFNKGEDIVTVNLARMIAEKNKKVLLIDCDLRKPKIHNLLGLNNLDGLSSILMENKSINEVIHKDFKNENFNILTSGPIIANPIKYLDSDNMNNLIKEMKKEFDMVVLYTPPLGIVTDSVVLSLMVDGVILIATMRETNREEMKEGKELLDKVNADIIGIAINKVSIKNYKHKQRYYEYYGE